MGSSGPSQPWRSCDEHADLANRKRTPVRSRFGSLTPSSAHGRLRPRRGGAARSSRGPAQAPEAGGPRSAPPRPRPLLRCGPARPEPGSAGRRCGGDGGRGAAAAVVPPAAPAAPAARRRGPAAAAGRPAAFHLLTAGKRRRERRARAGAGSRGGGTGLGAGRCRCRGVAVPENTAHLAGLPRPGKRCCPRHLRAAAAEPCGKRPQSPSRM